MQRRLILSNTQTEVTAIGLGAMPLSLSNRPDEATANEVIKTFIDLGGNFIDTANVYCKDDDDIGHNEKLITRILEKLGKVKDIVIATKGGLYRPRRGWEVDGSPEWLRKSCEQSLQDLNTESIFLYQLHAPDPNVPLTDSVWELVRLKEEGKIQHIGLSNVNTDEIQQALNLTPILSVQNKCSVLLQKAFNNGVVSLCAENNITFIPHSPVGGHFSHRELLNHKTLNQLAEKYDATVYQVALAWLSKQGNHILPIPGASKPESIKSSMESMEIELDAADCEMLKQ